MLANGKNDHCAVCMRYVPFIYSTVKSEKQEARRRKQKVPRDIQQYTINRVKQKNHWVNKIRHDYL